MPNKEKAMKQITLAIFAMVLGSFVITDDAGAEGREWKVVTVELAPGTADARHIQPGVELVYVLEGAGFLEADGKPKVALNPGAVTTLQPKQGHVLKNASQTRPLKVLVVLHLQNGGVRRQQAYEQPIF
ncbi:MAG: cupin domain-containing protein [Nitrospirae bacterium]|nr:MAG: cupin domain-containing protein [Nitrospirota bacterium]